MTISPAEALKEFDALPESAPKQKRDAYWRRYARLQNGLTDPCTYVEAGPAVASKPKPKPTADRLDMIKQVAAGVRPPAQPAARAATPAKTAVRPTRSKCNLPRGRRTSVIPKSKHAEIHYRINRQLADMGWGGPGIGLPAPHGAVTKLQKLTGIGSSEYHHTIRAGTDIFPVVLRKLHETMGINEEWLITGKGEPLHDLVDGAFYRDGKRRTAAHVSSPQPPASPALADLSRQLSALAEKIAEACGNDQVQRPEAR